MIISPDFKQERKVWQYQKKLIIAVDEAGRGSLAGPVVAGAFFIKKVNSKPLKPPIKIKDSKQLSPNQREVLFAWLKQQKNFDWAVGSSNHRTIDKINIRQANFLAMKKAIKKLELKQKSFSVFVDGNDKIPNLLQKQFTFVKGDAKIFSLACASIVAKVARDKIMIRLAKKYPQYGFEIHKGYGTKLHFKKIKKHGLSPVHRKTFLKKLNKK
ncbi:MAG: Ribonuclease HII [Parcubacteria group bacterium GW2011_GWC1_45_9]|nr:MAG: Ribonuclease HII [Parcubacteria group bacterium GW2011_GWA1_Parcubacteria_45_10]KKU16960.1 MAG: Ribonuclease HII [Parcubacteria group bacterium GW2011_GWC1_45_9]HCI05619.1 ribonuclease HII [Patescibacteria group bacterium]